MNDGMVIPGEDASTLIIQYPWLLAATWETRWLGWPGLGGGWPGERRLLGMVVMWLL